MAKIQYVFTLVLVVVVASCYSVPGRPPPEPGQVAVPQQSNISVAPQSGEQEQEAVAAKVSGQDGYMEGWSRGMLDAQPNIGWGAAGLGCGVFGLAGAYFWNYQPPMMPLIGKPPEYVMGYTQSYRAKLRNENTKFAAIGWGLWIGVLLVIYSASY